MSDDCPYQKTEGEFRQRVDGKLDTLQKTLTQREGVVVDHEKRIAENAKEIAVMKEQLKVLPQVATDVKAMRSTIDQAKGGWKAYLAIGALAGGLGAIVAWIAQRMHA